MLNSRPGHWLKLDRANQHLMDLRAAVTSFTELEPHGVEIKPQSEPSKYAIRGIYERNPPDRLSVLIGDCVHNLRSALDHVVWGLSMHYSNTADGSEFPIFLDGSKNAKPWQEKRVPASVLYKMRHVPPDAQTLIEGLQPYNRANGPKDLHPLWLLHNLDIEDKHHRFNIVAATVQGFRVVVGAKGSTDEMFIPLRAQSFEHGAILATLDFTQVGPDHEVHFYSDGFFNVAFSPDGPGKGLVICDTLTDIAAKVHRILVMLDPVFADAYAYRL
jgi:hypothetical protein